MILIENVSGQQASLKVYDVAITETVGSLDSLAFSYILSTSDTNDFNRNGSALLTPGSIITEPVSNKKFKLLTINPTSLGDHQQFAITAIGLGSNLHNYYVTNKLTSVTNSSSSKTTTDAKGNTTTTTSQTNKTDKTTVTIKTTTVVNHQAGTETITTTTTTKDNETGKTTTQKKVTTSSVPKSDGDSDDSDSDETTTDSDSDSDSSTTNVRSLDESLKMILDGTPFTYKITGDFGNFDFGGDFGGDYADTLLGTLATDFGFEYQFDGYTINICKEIGKKDAFLFVENANVAKISSQEDYTDITTEIEGYGKKDSNGRYTIVVGYKSPVKELWGRIDAKPIMTELTDETAIMDLLKKQIHDYPAVQYTLAYVDFKNDLQGFHNDPTPGNYGYLRSRFGIDLEVRIQSRTYYPQDTKNAGSITFGNKIFDPVIYQQKIQSAYRSNYRDSLNNEQEVNEITDTSLVQKLNELGGELL